MDKSMTTLFEDCVLNVLSQIISSISIVITILQLVFCFDHIIHVCIRLYFPSPIRPKLIDILPSSGLKLDYPMVAIQLPMFNEIECCKSAIECACNMDWPKNRLIIQVLDDSTNSQAMSMIDKCVNKWIDRGIQINVYRRKNRHGFKAGNLAYGLTFIDNVEYVAIFDADFSPRKDFLLKTLPSLMQDSDIAFVQARWTFTNAKETLLTRIQEITLNYHHKREQNGRYRASLFFGFHGTAGIWRTGAIKKSGGWQMDTLVEDLDLSLRCYLNGWRFVYLDDVECLNELPPTLSTYLSQQHRWKSGIMQVLKKLTPTICRSKKVSWPKKLYCLWYLFRSCSHLVTMFGLLLILPISMCSNQLRLGISIYILRMIISSSGFVMFTPDEIFTIPLSNIFYSALALHNGCATLSGLFKTRSSKEWIVTKKYGSYTTKQNENKETNLNKEHYYRLSFSMNWMKVCFQRAYQLIYKRFRAQSYWKRNICMSIYLLVFLYFNFEIIPYFKTVHVFCISMMYLVLAFGWIGRCKE